MSEEEFEWMEVGTFMLKLFFYNKKKDKERRYLGEVIRLQTLCLVNIQLSEGSQLKKPEQLWQFPWEREEGASAKRVTPQQQKAMIRGLRETAKKNLNG